MTNGTTWRIGDIIDMLPHLAEAPAAQPGLGGTAWFVLCVEPRAERRVAGDLRKAGMRAYVPEQTVMRKASHRRRYVRCLMPLFPGYVFADLAPTPDGWAVARAVRGVNGFITLGNGIEPLHVPDEVIGDLMSAVLSGVFGGDAGGRRIIKTGVRVVVLSGVYEGMAARVTRGGLVTAQVRIEEWPAHRKPITLAVDRLGLLA